MLEEANAELQRIDTAEAGTPPVLGMRMALLHESKDWPTLAEVAKAFIEQRPGEAAAWVTWAYATRRCVTLEAAEEILLEAERHHPAEATIQFNLGCYACLRGDLVTAQRRVDRAVALDPKFLQAAASDPDLAGLRAAGPERRS